MTSTHTSEVNLVDGRIVCLSYGVIVAAFLPGLGWVRTKERYSTTTSRHMNQFAGKNAPEMSHEELVKACAPVESRR